MTDDPTLDGRRCAPDVEQVFYVALPGQRRCHGKERVARAHRVYRLLREGRDFGEAMPVKANSPLTPPCDDKLAVADFKLFHDRFNRRVTVVSSESSFRLIDDHVVRGLPLSDE